MPERLRLVSVNIEMSKHLDNVCNFLSHEHADVVCLQEVPAHAIERLAEAAGAVARAYVPETVQRYDGKEEEVGLAILSVPPMQKTEAFYYAPKVDPVPESDSANIETYNNKNFPVLFVDIKKGDSLFTMATAHFTWTPDGSPSDLQRAHMKAMLGILEVRKSFVLTGDFNAPRGGEIFNQLADRYLDNIPTEYKTSIDIALHRAGKSRSEELADKMVDVLFTTPEYLASNVRLVSGISDHMAVTASIVRTY